MKKTAKVLLAVLCALLLVVGSVMGTLAWLTAQEDVLNTFTVGEVYIKLDEAIVNEAGVATGGRTEDGNAYHLYPDHEYVKDPTVTLLNGTDDCYVRMIVTASLENALTDPLMATQLDGIFVGYDQTKWDRVEKTVSADGKTITYEYWYYAVVNAENGDNALEPLFTSIAVPETYDNAEMQLLEGLKINVRADAIQKDGFATAEEAWAAFGQQYA